MPNGKIFREGDSHLWKIAREENVLRLVSSEHYTIYGSLFKAFPNNDGEQVL